MNSLVSAQIFNDDRDLILAKWNQLQAFYGFGKIYYQNQTINITDDNHLTRFKVILFLSKITKNSLSLYSRLLATVVNPQIKTKMV
jgi:hypothetical protein